MKGKVYKSSRCSQLEDILAMSFVISPGSLTAVECQQLHLPADCYCVVSLLKLFHYFIIKLLHLKISTEKSKSIINLFNQSICINNQSLLLSRLN